MAANTDRVGVEDGIAGHHCCLFGETRKQSKCRTKWKRRSIKNTTCITMKGTMGPCAIAMISSLLMYTVITFGVLLNVTLMQNSPFSSEAKVLLICVGGLTWFMTACLHLATALSDPGFVALLDSDFIAYVEDDVESLTIENIGPLELSLSELRNHHSGGNNSGQTDICDRCNVLQERGTHHCSICNRCCTNYDHHCVFLSNW